MAAGEPHNTPVNAMNGLKYITLVLFVLCGIQTFGQTNKSVSDAERHARYHLSIAEKLILTNADSSLFHALQAKKHLPEIKKAELKVQILQAVGEGYRFTDDLTNGLKYYLKAKSMVDLAMADKPGINLNLLRADVRIKIGTLYLALKNFATCIAYEEEALEILEKADKQTPKPELAVRKLKVYNNMAAAFISQQDFEKALVYFRNALDLNEIVDDASFEGSILNNIGICHLELKQLDLASHYFQKSLSIRTEIKDLKGQAQVLNNLGKNEALRHDFKRALNYFNRAHELSEKTGNNASKLVSLESLSLIHDSLGNYKEALRYHRAFKSLNDQIFNLETKTSIAALEQTHQREQDKKAYELKLKQNESDKLRSLVLVVALFLVLVVAVLIIFVMRSRIRTARLNEEKLTLERENLDLTHKTLEDNLEFKERELTAKALYLLKNNELMTRVTDNLQKVKHSLNKENYQLIQEIINDLQTGQRSQGWDEFEMHFTRVHSQFYQALQEKFPSLTSNEKKLCAFLRLNMSTKDISAVTNQSVNSITVARTRLRKKLGIDGEDVHLINFLMNLENC